MAAKKHTTDSTQLDLSFAPTEEWRDVPGYEGCYEVSNRGRVRSVDRYIYGPRGGRYFLKGVMRCRRNDRYYRVSLSKEGKIVHPNVHVLVLTAFVGPRPEGCVCNHKDGNKSNNYISNLEWVTQLYNSQHAAAKGLYPVGEKNGYARFTEEQVREMRRMAANGMSYSAVARHFGTSPTCARDIVKRKRWKHVE